MSIIAGLIMTLATLVGVVLTLMTLPGIWFIVLVALGCQWYWDSSVYSWWTLGIAAGLGVLAEIAELVASAFGAAKAGGTRRGAIGSVIGAIAGALIGAPFIPPLGVIAGGALGAGVGALVAERHGGQMTWAESARVGTGAAAGRLVATLLKLVFALVIGVILVVGAFVG